MANKYLLYSLCAVVLVIGGIFFINLGKSNRGKILPDENMSNTGYDQNVTQPVTPIETASGSAMVVSSPVLSEGQQIPSEFTCDGTDSFLPLIVKGVPEGTTVLAVVIDDPDAPNGNWTHFLAWNIDPNITKINSQKDLEGAVLGTNDFKKTDYGGPCPPSGTHRYYFKLFALDKKLELLKGTKADLVREMQGHIISQTSLMGTYSKK